MNKLTKTKDLLKYLLTLYFCNLFMNHELMNEKYFCHVFNFSFHIFNATFLVLV